MYYSQAFVFSDILPGYILYIPFRLSGKWLCYIFLSKLYDANLVLVSLFWCKLVCQSVENGETVCSR